MTTSEPLDLLPDSVQRRRTMVDCQIRTFDVTDPAVIARFLDIPREIFLPEKWRGLAYSDNALEVTAGPANGMRRQLLPPLVLARLMQGASVKSHEHVLDIASGSGYSTALLAGLAAQITALESDAAFVSLIETNLRTCQVHANVAPGSLTQGMAGNAPYDVIFINGAVEAELETLFLQLKEGGRLLAIQHDGDDKGGHMSRAIRYEKIAGEISSRFLFDASANILTAFQKGPQFVF